MGIPAMEIPMNSRDFFLSLNLDYLRTNLTVKNSNYAWNENDKDVDKRLF